MRWFCASMLMVGLVGCSGASAKPEPVKADPVNTAAKPTLSESEMREEAFRNVASDFVSSARSGSIKLREQVMAHYVSTDAKALYEDSELAKAQETVLRDALKTIPDARHVKELSLALRKMNHMANEFKLCSLACEKMSLCVTNNLPKEYDEAFETMAKVVVSIEENLQTIEEYIVLPKPTP